MASKMIENLVKQYNRKYSARTNYDKEHLCERATMELALHQYDQAINTAMEAIQYFIDVDINYSRMDIQKRGSEACGYLWLQDGWSAEQFYEIVALAETRDDALVNEVFFPDGDDDEDVDPSDLNFENLGELKPKVLFGSRETRSAYAATFYSKDFQEYLRHLQEKATAAVTLDFIKGCAGVA